MYQERPKRRQFVDVSFGQLITDASDKHSISAVNKFAFRHSQGLNVPVHFLQLLLLIEDKRFPHHPGFDVWGVLRALLSNVCGCGYRQGASTISQQLHGVRAARRGARYNRNIGQKLRQLLFGIRATWSLTKVQVLAEYLENVYWGGTTYGLDSASERFFCKKRNELSVEETIFLIARLASPNRHSARRIQVITKRKAVANILESHQSSRHNVIAFCERHA